MNPCSNPRCILPYAHLSACEERARVVRSIRFDDETHFLDHTIGSKRCRSLNSTGRKAVRLHWKYLREYKHTWDQRVLHRVFGCWLGHHSMNHWYRRNESLGLRCEWCDYQEGP